MALEEKACTEIGISWADSTLFWAVTTTYSKAKPDDSWAWVEVAPINARAFIFKARIVLRMVLLLIFGVRVETSLNNGRYLG